MAISAVVRRLRQLPLHPALARVRHLLRAPVALHRAQGRRRASAASRSALVGLHRALLRRPPALRDLPARTPGRSESRTFRLAPMRMRAAVLEEFGKPLAVQEVELAEPKAGEVLVRLEACGVCHTDMYTASGADPSGYAPTVLGHEGCGIVEKLGEGVSLVKEGDRVVTLFSPQCGECVHCLSPKTNLCMAIREEQNKGHLPDGTVRLSRGDEQVRHFMGTSTFAEYTVMPEIALAVVSPDAPRHPRGPVRVRALDRPGRRDQHREGGGGLHVRGLRRRPGGPGRRGGLPPAGRRADRLRGPLRGPPGAGARAGRHGHARRRRGHRGADPRDDRRLRAPTTRSRPPASSA